MSYKNKSLMVGHGFHDVHVLTDFSSYANNLRTATDIYNDYGGIWTVSAAMSDAKRDNNVITWSSNQAVLLNGRVIGVKLGEVSEVAIKDIVENLGWYTHMHISYPDLLDRGAAEFFIQQVLPYHSEIFITADLSKNSSDIDLSLWEPIIDLWIASEDNIDIYDDAPRNYVIHHKHGSIACINGEEFTYTNGTASTRVTNSCGAGDVFAGVFLAHYLDTHNGNRVLPIQACLKLAHEAATRAVHSKYNAGRCNAGIRQAGVS